MPSVDHLQASEDSPLADQDAFTAESAGDSSSDALTVGAGAMLHELDPLASLSQKIARAVDVTACSRDLDVDASIHPLERLARHLDAGTASAHAVDPKTGIKLAVPLDAAVSQQWITQHCEVLEAGLSGASEAARGAPDAASAVARHLRFVARRLLREAEADRDDGGSPAQMHALVGEGRWRERGGPELERWLQEPTAAAPQVAQEAQAAHAAQAPLAPPQAPVALVWADALIALSDADEASAAAGAKPAALPTRERLPAAAFAQIHELRAATHSCALGLPILALSVPWLGVDHPDLPQRWHLPRIAAFLRSFVRRGERRAVFWDVCSLPADAGHTGAFVHDDGERWEQGAPEEEEESGEASSGSASGSASGSPHRQKSLEGMAMLFSHPEVWVALQTAVPPGNHVPFVSRGLSFLHTSLAGLVRPGGRTLDLAAFEGKFDVVEAFQGALVESTVQQKKRTPPVIPESFERLLAEKSVRHDAERRALARLYRESFRVRIELAASLSYEGFGWGDAEMRVVVRALLYRGGLHRLKSLSLKGNAITDAGAASLARVINLRACPMLSHINLASNRIGRDGELLLATCQREQLSQHGFVVHFDTSRNELKDVLRGVPSDPLRDRDGLLRKELEEAKARFKDVRATVRAEFERALSR